MDKSSVGKFLKSLREQKGKKQYQVAMDLSASGIEVSDKTVAKWEKGNYPDINKLSIIADYYKVRVSDILNGEVYAPRSFEEKYFIVNNKWFDKYSPDKLYQTRVEQERLIKERVKNLLIELIKKKSLTAMQNDELNFLLENFYSISDYATQENERLANGNNQQFKLLRQEIYRMILLMHDCTNDEIYWEIKKLFDYSKRLTFGKDLCDYEDDVSIIEGLLCDLDDWEKDLLLAQVQTNNITHRYGEASPLTYLRQFGIDYDEERITKEGIKLLIKCGAKLNPSLLGYTLHRYEQFSILDRMEELHAIINAKILLTKYNEDNEQLEFYWAENNAKNRLIELYYAINCRRKDEEKISFDDLYKLFLDNDSMPDSIILSGCRKHIDNDLSIKEQLLQAKQISDWEIEMWRKSKDKEKKIYEYKIELQKLETQWSNGKQIGIVEYEKWVGEQDGLITENDILHRLSKMTYEQYIASRNTQLTEELLSYIDKLSLDEIRKRFFPVEEKYE